MIFRRIYTTRPAAAVRRHVSYRLIGRLPRFVIDLRQSSGEHSAIDTGPANDKFTNSNVDVNLLKVVKIEYRAD